MASGSSVVVHAGWHGHASAVHWVAELGWLAGGAGLWGEAGAGHWVAQLWGGAAAGALNVGHALAAHAHLVGGAGRAAVALHRLLGLGQHDGHQGGEGDQGEGLL